MWWWRVWNVDFFFLHSCYVLHNSFCPNLSIYFQPWTMTLKKNNNKKRVQARQGKLRPYVRWKITNKSRQSGWYKSLWSFHRVSKSPIAWIVCQVCWRNTLKEDCSRNAAYLPHVLCVTNWDLCHHFPVWPDIDEENAGNSTCNHNIPIDQFFFYTSHFD